MGRLSGWGGLSGRIGSVERSRAALQLFSASVGQRPAQLFALAGPGDAPIGVQIVGRIADAFGVGASKLVRVVLSEPGGNVGIGRSLVRVDVLEDVIRIVLACRAPTWACGFGSNRLLERGDLRVNGEPACGH